MQQIGSIVQLIYTSTQTYDIQFGFIFIPNQAKLEEQTQKAEKERDGAKAERMKAEAINEKLAAEKAELEESLARGDEVVQEMLGKVKHLETEKNQLDKQVRKIAIHQMSNGQILIYFVFLFILMYISQSLYLFCQQNTEVSRQLAEEEDACMSISNAMKKLASDAKRYKEATENMENK